MVYCIICGYSGIFLDINRRIQNVCPSCKSFERHRLFGCYWKEYFENTIQADMKLLHFAPEPCLTKLFKSSLHENYIASDLQNKNFLDLDITNIQLPNNSFNFLFASHVLEHVLNDKLAMKECYRILKKNGYAFFMIPQRYTLQTTYEDSTIVDPEQRLKHFGQSDHVRWYGLDFPLRLKEAGFAKVDVYCSELSTYNLKYVDGIHKFIDAKQANEMRIDKGDLIYACQKL